MLDKVEKIDIKVNRSKTYFLPLFNKFVPLEYLHNLVNTYFWYTKDTTEDTFCLLYKFDGRVKGEFYNKQGFTVFEEKMFQNPHFLGYCDYNEYVIYKFTIPTELIEKKIILLSGKYSQLSHEDKNTIIDFTLTMFSIIEATVIRKILHKDSEARLELAESLGYRDLPETYELAPIIDVEDEIFVNFTN